MNTKSFYQRTKQKKIEVYNNHVDKKTLIALILQADKLLMAKRCQYYKNRNAISKLFRARMLHTSFEEVTRLRLISIDGFYSTNVNRMRYYGIDDIVKHFRRFKSDALLRKTFLKSFKGDKHNVGNLKGLFYEVVGIHKNGNDAGDANSLISKFGYYITKFNFPIYDGLARESLFDLKLMFEGKVLDDDTNKIKELLVELKLVNHAKNLEAYFELLNAFKNILGSKVDFNKLDSFLWSLGKIKNGTYLNVVLSKNEYKRVIEELEANEEDKILPKLLKNCKENNSKLLNKRLKHFICKLAQLGLIA